MNNIILVGYMGSGKTTVGRLLAQLLDYSFADTDEMIEEREQLTISKIFSEKGEEAFRDMETGLLEELAVSGQERLVIATGGGMAVREQNRRLLRELGSVVYLKASPETVYDRIKGDTGRPLLQCDNPLSRIKEMIAQREQFYEEASHTVISVDIMKKDEIAQMIREAFVI